MKEAAGKAVEDELKNINGLKGELANKEAELKTEREGLEYDKREIEERLRTLKEILEGWRGEAICDERRCEDSRAELCQQV
ncbi:MAG: hypothetical protein U9R10_03485 [Euryarchaeota archaeon]|nr:hypothetical protein [Euryarchaeota archaeon]